jgi:hypothetical protein
MCRAPTVLSADRCTRIISKHSATSHPNIHIAANVDWALLNFMKDWFPVEARLKLKQNEREAAQEQMEELGFNIQDQGCLIA